MLYYVLFISICRIFKPKLSPQQPDSRSLDSAHCEIAYLFLRHPAGRTASLVATCILLGISFSQFTLSLPPASFLIVWCLPWSLSSPCGISSVQWTEGVCLGYVLQSPPAIHLLLPETFSLFLVKVSFFSDI